MTLRSIRRLPMLQAHEIRVLADAMVTVVLVRLCLWLVPSRLLLRRVAELVGRARTPAARVPWVDTLGWAVRAVSRRVPHASCLTQALATQILLARRGYSSELKIGVKRDPETGFAAHAWVRVGDQVLVGGRSWEIARYRELPDITTRL